MQRNVGEADQVVRLISGSLLLIAAITQQLDAWVWIAGFATVLSGSFGVCAMYGLLGLSTVKKLSS